MPRKLGLITALWRYPVKGMQGESIEQAQIDRNGVIGDRVFALQDLTPDHASAKSGDTSSRAVLGAAGAIQLRARYVREPQGPDPNNLLITAPNGATLISGDVGIDIFISSVLNRSVSLVALPEIAIARARRGRALHLLTTASLRKLCEQHPAGDFDQRRFRPNIVVASPKDQEGFIEDGWQGRSLLLGPEVEIRVEEPNMRCRVPTLQQGNLPFDPDILKAITVANASSLGVMCSVVKGGRVRVGDELQATA